MALSHQATWRQLEGNQLQCTLHLSSISSHFPSNVLWSLRKICEHSNENALFLGDCLELVACKWPFVTWTLCHLTPICLNIGGLTFARLQRPVYPGPLGWANRLHRFLFRKYVTYAVLRNMVQCKCDAWWDCALINQCACMIRLPIPVPLVKARRWGRAKGWPCKAINIWAYSPQTWILYFGKDDIKWFGMVE